VCACHVVCHAYLFSMLTLSDIRKGKMVVLDDQPYLVVSAEFLRKQQRRPVVRSVLKNIKTRQTKEYTFQQSDKVPEADIERRPYQFLYTEGGTHTFMDQTTYEQIEMKAELLSEAAPYLVEGQEATIILFDGAPVGVELPIKIDRRVTDAPPGVRGDTSSNVMKEVTVDGGLKVKAPLFIKEGDTIRIDTRSGQYVERA
ncbi:MAG: elongation factor P, partial [Acidobacteriota bacterium]